MCTKLFYAAKSKTPQVALLGANKDWTNTSNIGMQMAAEVCLLLFFVTQLTVFLGAVLNGCLYVFLDFALHLQCLTSMLCAVTEDVITAC
jgi:hypothetical protein